MVNKIINVSIKDRQTIVDGDPFIICGNSDYVMRFEFDAEWDNYQTRTARFVYTRRNTVKFQDVIFTGNDAQIPALFSVTSVTVGVFAGNLRTTTPARIPCRLSVRCGTGSPDNLTPSQYDRIMELLASLGAGIDITGATAGQVAQIAEVDENGVPTKWQSADLPKVYDWAIAKLPFTEAQISSTRDGAGFVTNPTNFADGKTYFRYHAGPTSFAWTNPNPQKGAVTITVLGWSQYADKATANGFSALNIVYADGTTGRLRLVNGQAVTMTTDAGKVLTQIKGNYDHENWVLLDMDVLSIVADYPAPTGTVKSVNGNLPDEDGNVEIDIPEGGGGDGTADHTLGLSGAAVGQIARITVVDDDGVPIAWESVDLPSGGSGGGGIDIESQPDEVIEITEDTVAISISEVAGKPLDASEICVLWEHPGGTKDHVPNYIRFNNEVVNSTKADKVLANWNVPTDMFTRGENACAVLIRVRRINNKTYVWEMQGNQQNPGVLLGTNQTMRGGVYRNTFGVYTSIKELYVYQSNLILSGTKISIWAR